MACLLALPDELLQLIILDNLLAKSELALFQNQSWITLAKTTTHAAKLAVQQKSISMSAHTQLQTIPQPFPRLAVQTDEYNPFS
jgi:hypothetical protein